MIHSPDKPEDCTAQAYAIQTPQGGLLGFCAPTKQGAVEMMVEMSGKPRLTARIALMERGWKVVPVEIRMCEAEQNG